MKRIVFFIVGLMTMVVCSVQAQQIENENTRQDRERQPQPAQDANLQRPDDKDTQEADEIGAGTQTEPGRSGREQYNTEDMVEVQAEQIPEALRRTLEKSRYKGWEENGTLYQDPATADFVLVMDKGDNAPAPRMYRFDRRGKPQQ